MIKIEIVHNSFTFINEKLLLFITFDVTSFMQGPFYNVTRAKKKSDGHFERLDIPWADIHSAFYVIKYPTL